MELVILILGKLELLDDALSAVAEVGAYEAAVVEAEGLEKILATDIPIFAGLRQMLDGGKEMKTLITAILLPGATVDELDKLLLDRGIDFRSAGTGVLASVKLDKVIAP
jgi:hypothetical protein